MQITLAMGTITDAISVFRSQYPIHVPSQPGAWRQTFILWLFEVPGISSETLVLPEYGLQVRNPHQIIMLKGMLHLQI